MKRTISNLMLAGSLLAGGQAMAGDWVQWQDNSLTYLYGKDYTVNPPNQQTVTFEHADGWKYGDNFLFIDKTFYNGQDFHRGMTMATRGGAKLKHHKMATMIHDTITSNLNR